MQTAPARHPRAVAKGKNGSATKRQSSPGNEALTKKIAGIKQLLIEADQRDVAARYEIAVECQAIIAGDGKGKVYGTGAARKLGKALGWSKTAVYAYVAVAETWNKEKFRELAEKRDKFEKPLSWSHFMVLAAEKDAKRRRDLISKTHKAGWSVRDLKRAVAGMEPKAAKAAGAEEPKPPRPLTAAIANFTTGLNTAKANADVYGKEIAKQVGDAEPSVLKTGSLEQLKKARADLEILYQTQAPLLDALIAKIEAGAKAGTRRPKGTRK